MRNLFLIFASAFISTSSFAASGSGWSMGALGGIVTTTQGDLAELQKRANTANAINTPAMGNALEFAAFLERRFASSSIALQLRPSYFTQSTTGTGVGGTYSYSLSGFTVTPMLKAYILENKAVMLYIQGGVGWGLLSTKVVEGGANASFSGSNFGFQGGLGVEFCLGAGTHCFMVEGNMRYMSMDRNILSDTTGNFPSTSIQNGKGMEAEYDNHDLATTMSGVQGLVGYVFNF